MGLGDLEDRWYLCSSNVKRAARTMGRQYLWARLTRPPRPLNPKTQVEMPDQNMRDEAAASLSASVVSEAIIGARVVETKDEATGPDDDERRRSQTSVDQHGHVAVEPYDGVQTSY